MNTYKIAIRKRLVTFNEYRQYVFDVWSWLGDEKTGQWQSVANAVSPHLIKEFWGVEVS
jgi:hypothetical protein